MIELISKDKCSGCSACLNACKVGALSMVTDETGFWFPHIDREKCVECRACMRACPALEKYDYESESPKAYIVQNKDDEIRRQSTSGGAFTGIAQQIIKQGGVVFGATFDENLRCVHTCVDRECDLVKFRNSKYVQSNIGYAYREVEKFLKAGRKVCFSGTPCQVYGLKKYLGGHSGYLITVDFMCHSVPSPKVFERYIEYQRDRHPGFDGIALRDKKKGYSYSNVVLTDNGKEVYRAGSEFDPWMRLFLGGYCNRELCHNCIFQTGTRASDITMWDCWTTKPYEPKWDDNKGTTYIVAWNELGSSLIENAEIFRYNRIDLSFVKDTLIRNRLPLPQYNREQFFEDSNTLSGNEFINKYVPVTTKIRLKAFIRNAMIRLHVHDFVRSSVHKVRALARLKRD